MKVVGLTGGIGSGKTTVGRIFSVLGVPVYNADQAAKWLSDVDPSIVQGLTALFGKDIYQGGLLQRSRLADFVFKDADLLQKVNEIIHPVVENHFLDWAKPFQYLPYVVKEAAILVENGGYKRVDHLILVVAPEDLRIRRVLQRDDATLEQVKARIACQMGDAEKMAYANSIICCDEIQLVIPQVLTIHQKLIL